MTDIGAIQKALSEQKLEFLWGAARKTQASCVRSSSEWQTARAAVREIDRREAIS